METEFKILQGKTITEIDGLTVGSERVTFTCSDGTKYVMLHYSDCCESVDIEDVAGDVDDLIGSEILLAEESTSDENPEGVKPEYQDSFTWTYYKLATINGYVTIRWYGSSNGYYSESVNFEVLELLGVAL